MEMYWPDGTRINWLDMTSERENAAVSMLVCVAFFLVLVAIARKSLKTGSITIPTGNLSVGFLFRQKLENFERKKSSDDYYLALLG